MQDYEPFISLAVALGVGLLIGVQREQQLAQEGVTDKSGLGGVRTYPLFSLAGALATLLSRELGTWFVGATFGVLLIPLAIAYADDVRTGRDRGLTSKLAFVVSFLLGSLSLSEKVIVAPHSRLLVVAAVAVVVTALLSLKQPLHTLAAHLSLNDLYAAIKFLVLAVIVLPLLPNKTFDPFDVLNPFNIGLMIVLIAAVGLFGYALIRVMGPGRGLGLIGLLGGLISSTVVTLEMSGRARKEPSITVACALAAVLASSVMIFRVLVVVGVVHTPMLSPLVVPMLCALAAGFVCAQVLYRREQRTVRDNNEIKFTNPFELSLAIKFGLLFAGILLVSAAATKYLGRSGTYAAAFLSGLTDLDAISLSMAQFARDGKLPIRDASHAILLAVLANTLLKGSVAVSLGGWLFGRKVVLSFVAMMLAGAAGLFFTLYM